jgi:hypothetical protein
MLNFGQLVSTVQQNCHISDARYAGEYTVCIFLLKMREFYRWENDIPYSGVLPKNDIGEWLHERERLWSDMESLSFAPLPLDQGGADPFDSDGINRELVPQGYVYSGGYGRFSKPHFFLGDLIKTEKRGGYTVYITACEYARDLVAPPAMMQNQVIYLRQESVRRYLWEKIEEWRWSRTNRIMQRALSGYRLDDDLDNALDAMVLNESESMILHEVGEAMAGEHLGPAWNDMLMSLASTKTEIMARAVRDLLADNLSTLPGLIDAGNEAALHFYFANYTGMRKYLFPEALNAYQSWVDSGHWRPLQALVAEATPRWTDTAQTMLHLYQRQGASAGPAIEALLEPAAKG